MGRRGKRNDARPVPTPEVPPAPAEAAEPVLVVLDESPTFAGQAVPPGLTPSEVIHAPTTAAQNGGPAPARKRFRVRLPGVEALTVEADDEAGAFEEYKRRLGITGTVHKPEIALET